MAVISGGGGGGGSVSAPLTLTGTDPVAAPELSVVASPDQTAGTDFTNLTEVRDSNGGLLWVTEFDGGTRHVWDIRVQGLTDPGPVFSVSRDGATTWGDHAGAVVGEFHPTPGVGAPVFAFNSPDGHIAIQVYGDATGAANAVEVYGLPDFNLVFAVTATGGIRATLPAADPHVVGELWNNAGAVKVSAG